MVRLRAAAEAAAALPAPRRARRIRYALTAAAVAALAGSLAAVRGEPSNLGVRPGATTFQLMRADGGVGGISGDAIWASTWWEGTPVGPLPYLLPPAGGEEICIWHDLGPTLVDLDEGLAEAGLPLSFWRQPDSGGHPGVWGVDQWAVDLLRRSAKSDHFDLVACPEAAEVPPTGTDVEPTLPEGRPPTGRPLHLWIFWDTVPDPPPGHLPGVINRAFSKTRLPALAIGTSPDAVDGVPDSTVVNIATWLWVDPTAWRLHAAKAAGGGYVATVWAVPSTVRWTASWDFNAPGKDPQGGTTVRRERLDQRCAGPGLPYDRATEARSTDCSFVFTQSSFGTYQPIYAEVTWVVHWALANGAGVVGGEGMLPLVHILSVRALRVMQVEAVISNA